MRTEDRYWTQGIERTSWSTGATSTWDICIRTSSHLGNTIDDRTPWKKAPFLLPKSCCIQKAWKCHCCWVRWRKGKKNTPPLPWPLPLCCPSVLPHLGCFSSLVQTLDSFSTWVKSQMISLATSQFNRVSLETKQNKTLGALILGNEMQFLWGIIWPQVTRSTKVVPCALGSLGLFWAQTGSPCFVPKNVCLGQMTTRYSRVFPQNYNKANRIQLMIGLYN